MDWKLEVPKILHVYWGGGKLSWVRYCTVETFRRLNPDWEIRFYYPLYPTTVKTWLTPENKLDEPETDYTQTIMGIPITKIPIDFRNIGFKNEASEVHKSDVLRLHLLSTVGGMWSDMDIFYFKPMSEFYLNKTKYSHIDTFYCNRVYGHSIGFLMATQGNELFKELYDLVKYNFTHLHYQSLGANLYNQYFREPKDVERVTPHAINISMDVVYSHPAGDTAELLDPKQKPKFTKKSLGIHWFGGDTVWQDFLLNTDGGLKNLPKCIMTDLLNTLK